MDTQLNGECKLKTKQQYMHQRLCWRVKYTDTLTFLSLIKQIPVN